MSNREWFVGWFDSPYYDLLYQNRNEKEASEFLEKLLAVLNPVPDSRMFDIPCGNGRYAKFLAQRGFEVKGVDLSKRKIQDAKKYETEKLSFAVHDMSMILYVNYFDFVFNLFTSFGYYESERKNMNTIRTFSSALKRGGKLVLDFFNAEKKIKNLNPESNKTINDVVFKIKRRVEGKYIIKDILVDDTNKKLLFQFQERVQAFTLNEFEKYFSANQLRVVQLFGDYNLNVFNPQESERLVLIAEKI